MKALAASSVGQYERAVQALESYYRTVALGLCVCFATTASTTDVAHGARPVRRGVVLFGSDQGLVGRFNEVMMDFVAQTLRALPEMTTQVWVAGQRMQELVADAGWISPLSLPIPNSVGAIGPLVDKLLVDIFGARAQDRVDEVYLFHNRPGAAGSYHPISKRLFPIDSQWQRDLKALRWPTRVLPEVIGGSNAPFDAFIREYLFVSLYQACAESLASENAARLAAMQRAEDNITRILDELDRSYRRMRQESIDEGLFEVVSGYEALSQAPKSTTVGTLTDRG
jgi:F-type H+-transporting ATPase subunit gamma